MNIRSTNVTRIQSGFEQSYREMTQEQKKHWYETLYDVNGNIKPNLGQFKHLQNSNPIIQNIGDMNVDRMNGYAIARVGDDYVTFAMNPSINIGGGKDLTAEQVEYLRNKYDMNNLSKEDRIKLLAELSCLGIISGQQAYEEAFPERCSWLQDKQSNYGISNTANDLDAWIQYFLDRMKQARDDISELIASKQGDILYIEEQRRTENFYTKLAHIMNQLKD